MAKIEITMLGTSGSAPTKERNLSSTAIRYDGKVFLFDCGEGTQRQMFKYHLNISKIAGIFITHIHGDHIIGIAGLIRTLALYNRLHPLPIYVPEGYKKNVERLIDFDKAMIGYRIDIIDVKSGNVFKNKDISIRAFKLKHSITSYGYVFKENDTFHFIKSKASAIGIKGEMFSNLVKNKRMKIKGNTIKLEEVTEKKHGKKIVYATDTRPSAYTVRAAASADLLIHDASYEDKELNLARMRMHSTAREAATIADKSSAKLLILTHISTRYKDTKLHLEESKEIFENTKIAEDGMKLII